MSRESNKDIEKIINKFKAKINADRKDFQKKNAVQEANRFQPADTFGHKLNKNPEVQFNTLRVCTGEPYQSTSSLTSSVSAPEKVGSSNNRLVVRSNSNKKWNNPSSLNDKREVSNNDLGLIGDTTSPYRSEWENRNRPFCTRFYPLYNTGPADIREIEKEKFISILSSEKSQYGFLPPNPEKCLPSIIQPNSISHSTERFVGEAEKDRLAQIFAFSSPLKKSHTSSDLKNNDFTFKKANIGQPQCFSSLNVLHCTSNDTRNKSTDLITVDPVPEDILCEDSDKDINFLTSTSNSPSFQNEKSCQGNCKCSSSLSPCLERNIILNKAVQTDFDNFSTPLLQEIVSKHPDHYPRRKQHISPLLEDQCYSNKQIEICCDTLVDSPSNTFTKKEIVSPFSQQKDYTVSKLVDLCNNEKQNLSPRRFIPTNVKNEDKSIQFSPLHVATSPNHSGKKMVRIGEFSPLNPKLNSPGQALIGLGEYEERRKLLMDQRKHEYCQYLEQARLVAKSNQVLKKSPTIKITQDNSHLTNMKDVATQTNCSNPIEDFYIEQESTSFHTQGITPVLEQSSKICGLTSVQMKQFLYREELRKQIEERQRIDAEKREKEKLEEEAIEAKIKQQQEEMQIKYEAEMAERMKLARKKKEQEEVLHHRLAEMQKQTLQDKKQQRRHQKDMVELSPRNGFQQDSPSRLLTPEKEEAVISQRTPENVSLSSYRQEREKIFKEIADIEKQYSGLQQYAARRQTPAKDEFTFTPTNTPEKKQSYSEPIKLSLNQNINKRDNKNRAFTVMHAIDFNDPVSRLAHQHPEGEDILRRPLIESIPPHLSSPKPPPIRTKALLHVADDILQQPLLPPVEAEEVKNIRDAIPLLPRSNSPPIPAATTRARTNSEALDDKWQIPAVEKYLMTPLDIHSHNSRSVLTQLGAFRKHLQQEQMRMARDLKSTNVKSS